MNIWNRFKERMQGRKRKEQETSNEGKNSLDKNLLVNINHLKQDLGDSSDLVIRHFEMGGEPLIKTSAVYISGLVNEKNVNEFVSGALKVEASIEKMTQESGVVNSFDFIKGHAHSVEKVTVVSEWDKLLLAVLSGYTVILIDGYDEAITGDTKGGETRGVNEPSTQLIIRGPKVAFTESIGTNVALIRRYLKSPDLRFETMQVGSISRTDVAVMYMKGIASEKVLREIKARLNKIEVDDIIDSGYIEQYIQDTSLTLIPTIYNTERPDSVVGNLMEGRIAIIVDGTPFVLVAPALFIQFFQTPSDYYQNFVISSFLRLLRVISFTISLLTPSLYIALTTFHPQMIPTALLVSLAAQQEGVPFPLFMEVLLMEFTFEIIREAGLRMPRAVGQAVSIVGGLVLGQAAVQAGIVSATTIIVVALTGIASFAVPSYNIAVAPRILRFSLMIIAGSFGLYGVLMALFILIAHMSSLRSLGIPYLSPFAPFIWSDIKDSIIRQPLWSMNSRPRLINQQNVQRQAKSQKPVPSDPADSYSKNEKGD
ncbi:spore germination protein [Halobacillus karajensis]|uniref:Spore germination protein B1 n=1 Tax=Halobacillus karajensis TaxID=195088 RepID=A0A024P4D8_9BACI|nr:spore germination protein [Halobacillus karajensis]CDQ20805.1 Spore germination protein B1 [Halobacillus karajensis]CDQ23725.1 Spore germination protein B1 [Halobacillus karajensis]CDQ27203.1 Spore germination protein B1 [Halobacillus karajensis]